MVVQGTNICNCSFFALNNKTFLMVSFSSTQCYGSSLAFGLGKCLNGKLGEKSDNVSCLVERIS